MPKTAAKKQYKLAEDVDEVLGKVRALRDEMRRKSEEEAEKEAQAALSMSSDDDDDELGSGFNSKGNDSDDESYQDEKVPSAAASAASGIKKRRVGEVKSIKSVDAADIIEVDEMSSTEVLEGIEGVAIKIVHQVLNKQGFAMEIPSRAASNQIYVPELDRIVLGSKRGTRSFLSVKESRKTAITTRVLQLLHSVLRKRIHITKRDLFYTDVKLFVDQAESDGVLDDIACMLGCTRSNLHVVASDKGLVVGRISFVEDGDFIDCTKMGVGGKAIPPYIGRWDHIDLRDPRAFSPRDSLKI
jgi:hypothetical protein